MNVRELHLWCEKQMTDPPQGDWPEVTLVLEHPPKDASVLFVPLQEHLLKIGNQAEVADDYTREKE